MAIYGCGACTHIVYAMQYIHLLRFNQINVGNFRIYFPFLYSRFILLIYVYYLVNYLFREFCCFVDKERNYFL